MTATALIGGGGGFWPELWSQRRDPQRNVISFESSQQRLGRDVTGTFVVHARAGIAVDRWQREGTLVRTVARTVGDLNGKAIESLYANATGGAQPSVVVALKPSQSSAELARAALRVGRLTEIQASLGLPMQALAEVLRVSRPQLYKWFDAGQTIRLQEESAARLNAIELLAQNWRARSAAPLGPWLREHVEEGRSLSDMLTAEVLPVAEIERAFDTVIARFRQAPKSRGQRMREAGFTRRPTHRSLPSDA